MITRLINWIKSWFRTTDVRTFPNRNRTRGVNGARECTRRRRQMLRGSHGYTVEDGERVRALLPSLNPYGVDKR